jgi:hypothetical protein
VGTPEEEGAATNATSVGHRHGYSHPSELSTSMTVPSTFHGWPQLPVELKMQVLSYALRCSVDQLRVTPLYHTWYMRNWWTLGRMHATIAEFISTRNRELVELALDSCKYGSSDRDLVLIC